MSSISRWTLLQQSMTSYGITTYTIIANIGLLFNIVIFSQSVYRRNSASLYLLATSIFAFIALNASLIPIIYSNDNLNLVTTSSLFCQITFYFRHSFNQMMRTFFVLACADRYAISTNQARIRLFSQYHIALRIIIFVISLWSILAFFPAVLRSYESIGCSQKLGLYNTMFSIYISTTVGIIPLICMIVFSILLRINLKQIRRRIQPINNNTDRPMNQYLRRRDRDMLKMLLIEIICYIFTTVPLPTMLIYRIITQSMIKTSERLQIEAFLIYFTSIFLLYINNGLSFWIYIFVSRSFRLEFKNLILKVYLSITGKQIRTNENT